MPSLHTLRRRLERVESVRKAVGLPMTLRLLGETLLFAFDANRIRALRDRLFDRRYGIRTSGFKTLEDLGLGVAGENSHNYRGVPVALFDAAFASLSLDYPRFEFVDYGSGMGKALLLAARFPFRRITGVEFAPELHKAAEHNISTWRMSAQRCFDVRSVLADASTWPLPEGDCVLFFFNPFREPLMRAVLRRIIQDAKAGNVLYLVYIHPTYPQVFADFPALRPVVEVSLNHVLYSVFKIEV
jgi:hypothetical protein